jgi:hypothetical protein
VVLNASEQKTRRPVTPAGSDGFKGAPRYAPNDMLAYIPRRHRFFVSQLDASAASNVFRVQNGIVADNGMASPAEPYFWKIVVKPPTYPVHRMPPLGA